jgi:hypothetical protein
VSVCLPAQIYIIYITGTYSCYITAYFVGISTVYSHHVLPLCGAPGVHGRIRMVQWVDLLEGMESMVECKKAIKEGAVVDEKKRQCSFKWDKLCPGNGKTNAYFTCNSHEGCLYRLRLVHRSGMYYVQHQLGLSHTENWSPPTNKSGTMTLVDKKIVTTMLNSGAKPAAIWCALTKTELDRCRAEGKEATKRLCGGLAGI